MGVHDAPQWLVPAWIRACVAAGASAPVEEIEAAGERLLARWGEPDRHYHNVRHLTEVLARVDELALAPGCTRPGIEEHSWKKKAEAFERIFERVTGTP